MEFRRLLLPQLWSRDELVAFLYNLDEKNRFDAHEYCLSIGGYLVEIDTEEEEDWLLGAFAVYDQVWELENIYIYTFLSTRAQPVPGLEKWTKVVQARILVKNGRSYTPATGLLDWAD